MVHIIQANGVGARIPTPQNKPKIKPGKGGSGSSGSDKYIEMGMYAGNGVNDRLIPVTFQPGVVIVKSSGASVGVIRTSTMNSGDSKRFSANAITTNYIKTFTSTGFTVGTDALVNSVGNNYYWVAIKERNNFCKCVNYTGNASDDRTIAGVGFTPDAVLILAGDNNSGIGSWLSDRQPAGQATRFNNGNTAVNRIQTFNSDGFQIGTDVVVNTNLVAYHAICLKKVNNVFDTYIYTGNGADNRSFTPFSFQPQFLWIQNTLSLPAVRFNNQVGDVSSGMGAVADQANRVQEFISGGFQVGSDSTVNVNTLVHYVFALRQR